MPTAQAMPGTGMTIAYGAVDVTIRPAREASERLPTRARLFSSSEGLAEIPGEARRSKTHEKLKGWGG